jgi:hypothetical protein
VTGTHALSKSTQPRRLYPSHLELFHQCRRRFHLKVVERRPTLDQGGPALGKGTVAHEVLKICGREWMESASMPADLRTLVAARLPHTLYPSAAVWERDVAEVVDWVKYGLASLDPYATVLGVEQFLDRSYRPEDGSAPVPLGVVVDLLLLRTDANGVKFVEIVDYKTGKHLDASPFAPVISRFVLKRLIAQHLPGDSFAPVVFTELYLAQRHARTSELTLERCLADWEEVKLTLAAIAAESAWAPRPSPLCEWCPFNGNGCVPMTDEDTTSLW